MYPVFSGQLLKFFGGFFGRVNTNLTIRSLNDTARVVQDFYIFSRLLFIPPAGNLAVAAGE
jgi:hypothetical protein